MPPVVGTRLGSRAHDPGSRRLRGRFAAAAGAVPSRFWGVVPQATPASKGFSASSGAASTASASRSPGARCSRCRAAYSTGRASTLSSAARPRRASRSCLSFRRADVGGAFGSADLEPARPIPARSDRRPAAGWTRFVEQAILRYGPAAPSGPKTRPAQTADPDLADLERAELQVLRRPAEPGRIRQAVNLSYGDQSGRAGRKIVLGGMFARPIEALTSSGKPPQAYFATDFLDQMYGNTPGSGRKFQGVALHPYTGS